MTTPSGQSPWRRSVRYWFFSDLWRRRAGMSEPVRARPRASAATGARSSSSRAVSTVSVVCAAMMRKSPPPAIPWINRSGPCMSHGERRPPRNCFAGGSSFARGEGMRRTIFMVTLSAALAAFGCMKKQADGTYKVDTAEAKAKTKTSGDELKTDLQKAGEKLKKGAENARDSAAVRRAEEKAGAGLEKAGEKLKEAGPKQKPCGRLRSQ